MIQSSASCSMIRSYATKWSVSDCIGFLSRKNINDLFEFDFTCRDGLYYITFGNLWPREPYCHHHPRSTYSIFFERQDGQTVFTVRFDHTEGFMSNTSFVLTEHMDRFFQIKLDARKKWPGEA